MGWRLFLVLIGCTLLAAPLVARQNPSDPLTGTWRGDWGATPAQRNQVTLDLKWDGKTLTGTANLGPNALSLKETSFDPTTGAVHFEIDVTAGNGTFRIVINAKLESVTMTGTWTNDNRNFDFKVAKD